MSALTDGLHATAVEGSIYPGPLVIYDIAYEVGVFYGRPISVQKFFAGDPKQPPTEQKNPLAMGDEHKHFMHDALHKLLSGQLTLTDNRQLLSDRPKR